jgi:structural maintenance of chromosome 4
MVLTRSTIEQLKKERYEMFIAGYNSINFKLKETYQVTFYDCPFEIIINLNFFKLLTNGGDAELELLDSLDPFSEGVVFSVRPPKKSWKQMNKLSGIYFLKKSDHFIHFK